MTRQRKDIETILVHEFWCCKRELENFNNALSSINNSKETKLIAFTFYGNFIRNLYSFYEGIIESKNKKLLSKCKNKFEIGQRISELLTMEIAKFMKNNPSYSFEINKDFGLHFRQIRNRFSHAKPERVREDEIDLSKFYNLYHQYVLMLFDRASLSWNIEKIESYDWLEIENFMNETLTNSK
jgi:hypothetical protein